MCVQGKPSPGSVAVSPVSSSSFILSPTSYTSQNPGSTSVISDSYEPSQSLSSPGSVEVCSEIAIKANGIDSEGEFASCVGDEVNRALRKLEEQLSLNDDIIEEFDSLSSQDFEYKNEMSKQDQFGALLQSSEYALQGQYNSGNAGFLDDSNNLVLSQDAGRLSCVIYVPKVVVSYNF